MTSGSAPPIRVLLVDDHDIVREGILLLLQSEADLCVVGQAADGLQALEEARRLQPDVVLLDIDMPRLNGLETARRLHAAQPQVAILFLTMHNSPEIFLEAVRAAASGYVLKKAPRHELLQAIRTAAQGEACIPPELTRRLIERYRELTPAVQDAGYEALSERERQVLLAIAQGSSNREIAERLNLTASTVQTYRAHILEKLNLANTVEIVRYAIRVGLIDA